VLCINLCASFQTFETEVGRPPTSSNGVMAHEARALIVRQPAQNQFVLQRPLATAHTTGRSLGSAADARDLVGIQAKSIASTSVAVFLAATLVKTGYVIENGSDIIKEC